MEVKKQLRDINFEMIYEYPKISILSYENIIKDDELKLRTSNEIKKIIRFIEEGIMEDEELKLGDIYWKYKLKDQIEVLK